jgi:hypothetical protein
VTPEAGSALFWFNVQLPCASPLELRVDPLTLHAGEPVTAGTKYVCNKWVHPLPYKTSSTASSTTTATASASTDSTASETQRSRSCEQ